jgi:1-acyl-sn-glycerol-3-phosphate acyltransferase
VSVISRLIILYVRSTRRIVVRGALPSTACVAVSFHRSLWDGLLVCMLDPRITAVASRAWKAVPGVGRYLETYGVIWTDEHVVAKASRYVADGGICWLAPCGFIRSGGCPHPHSGAAQIARAAGVPVVCVTLRDGGRPPSLLGRRRLTVVIGKPLPTAAGEPAAAVTHRLVAALRAQERQPNGPCPWGGRARGRRRRDR